MVEVRDGKAPTTVVAGVIAADLSADERQLAYVRDGGRRCAVRKVDGMNPFGVLCRFPTDFRQLDGAERLNRPPDRDASVGQEPLGDA